jgi:DNA helicase-2/ATP-dependent DNA helicase PcrA
MDKNWSSIGFMNKAQEEKTKSAGQEMLSRFYEVNKPFNSPLTLEQNFLIKISPELKLKGRIDRIDKIGNQIEIIDYKTGKVMDQKEVDKSLQMTAYGLAVADKGTLNKKSDEVILTFYFLDSGEKKSTTRSAKQLETAKKEIQNKAKEISESKFEPTPGFQCDFCEYRMICEAWR